MGGMKTLLLLCVGVTVSRVVDLYKRIFGGDRCNDNERQYHVKLRANNGTHYSLCGGSLISHQWILTAAHCWKKTMEAYLGVHPGPEAPPVDITDPVFWNNNRNIDIMLLKLPDGTRGQHRVRLPKCGRYQKPPVGDIVQTAGYGPTVPGPETPSSTLQCANLNVVQCKWDQITTNHPEPERYLFCGENRSVTTRSGDSGGGVVFNRRIYGVHISSAGILWGSTALMMDVCFFMPWITETTGLPAP